MDDDHHEILQRLAESEGTTISALLRRAAIKVFSLPTGSGKAVVASGVAVMPPDAAVEDNVSDHASTSGLDHRYETPAEPVEKRYESTTVEPVLSGGSENGGNADATPA